MSSKYIVTGSDRMWTVLRDLPYELRMAVWEHALPIGHELVLSIALVTHPGDQHKTNHIKGWLYLHVGLQSQVFCLLQKQIALVSRICRESRSVVLSHCPDLLRVYGTEEKEDQNQRTAWTRCSLRNDLFILGQVSSTSWTSHVEPGLITQWEDCGERLSQQLKGIRNLLVRKKHNPADIIGMKSVDGNDLSVFTPELTSCILVMSNLRELLVAPAIIDLMHTPSEAKTLGEAAQRALKAEVLKKRLGLQISLRIRVVCQDAQEWIDKAGE